MGGSCLAFRSSRASGRSGTPGEISRLVAEGPRNMRAAVIAPSHNHPVGSANVTGGAMTTIHAAPIAFSVAEVADLLGCSTDTVRRMIGSGLLEAVQPLGKGGRVFVGRSSIEQLFATPGAPSHGD